jgi:tellurite resistance protein
MTTSTTLVPTAERPLQYLPIALFGSIMGLTGLSSAWHLAHARFGAPAWIYQVIGAIAVVAFIALLCAYGVKLFFSTDAVRTEFNHPIASNLFGTLIISALLVPLVIAPVVLWLAQAIWAIGVVAMILFAWRMVDRWISNLQAPEHATPAWIVPVVGLLDVPLAMPVLELPPELQVLRLVGLAIGLFFSVPLFTLIFARLMFQPRMPPALQPTLLILLAPFSVGVSTYVVTVGRIDTFAEALYLLALFMLAVLVGQLRSLLRCCPFRVGWWAVSFPLASMAIAGMHMVEAFQSPVADAVAWALLAFATIVIAWLAWRTLSGVARGELKALTA